MKIDHKYHLRLKCEQPHLSSLDTTLDASLHPVIKPAILVPPLKQMY